MGKLKLTRVETSRGVTHLQTQRDEEPKPTRTPPSKKGK